jgi:outer membrane lipoprotein carrier protein
MIRIAVAILLSAVLFSPALGARETARVQLDRFAEQLATLSGQFAQTTLDPDGFVSEASSGEIYFAAPDRFRWRYLEPFPQELVADGRYLWHYDESLEQVTQQDQPSASESPLLVLTQPELLDRFYSIGETGDPDLIEFRPLAEDAEFERARLYFADGAPVALEFNDSFGQTTRIDLFDLRRNPELDPALFDFVPPPGADVLQGF